MENQGKKKSQMEDSETFAFIALMITIIMLLLLSLTSCNNAQSTPSEEEKVYIEIDGQKVELVADEYGGQYLKQITRAGWIYIPYPGETEEADSLQFYQTKNQ